MLDLSGLGNDLGINYKTVRAWISVLEASYVAFLLPPHHENFSKRLIKSPKLYFHDTGLLCSLLGLESAEQLATHYLRGAIFENWVISEIIKEHVNAGRRPDLYFWRDNTGNELDLLYERSGRRQVVEIKAGATLGTDQFKGLRYYRKLATAVPVEQDYYLVYGGEERQDRAHGTVLGWRDIGAVFIRPIWASTPGSAAARRAAPPPAGAPRATPRQAPPTIDRDPPWGTGSAASTPGSPPSRGPGAPAGP